MEYFIAKLRMLSNANLGHMLQFTYSEYQKSADTLQLAIQAQMAGEPIPTPIWGLKEAYEDNHIRFQLVIAEIERRDIP